MLYLVSYCWSRNQEKFEEFSNEWCLLDRSVDYVNAFYRRCPYRRIARKKIWGKTVSRILRYLNQRTNFTFISHTLWQTC